MRILVTGQCSLHEGRLENGNIGNYYITETSFRELHRVFPTAEIVTTFQMTEDFQRRENIRCLPMSLFYNWDENDLSCALEEYAISEMYVKTGKLYKTTGYIEEVLASDLIIDFSGELWGDHAEPVGHNRFLVGLLKLRTAQLLGKKTVLLASSEGPFSDLHVKEFAKEVFANYAIVSNRESASKQLLVDNGFDVSKVHDFVCPAFLFEPSDDEHIISILEKEHLFDKNRVNVGYILCGFNMLEGPYDKTPRRDDEFVQFAESIEFLVNELGCHVVLMSHQNGFEKNPFKLINGRDYPIIKQLHDVLAKRNNVDMKHVVCVETPHNPWETKGIIKHLDMLVTGRVHGFVAGVSSNVPTVLINRGFGPISHRNIGFARAVGLEEYIADPHSVDDMKKKLEKCYVNRTFLRENLLEKMPHIQLKAHNAFDVLLTI